MIASSSLVSLTLVFAGCAGNESIHLNGEHAKRIALLQVQAIAEYTARLGSVRTGPPPH